MKHTYKIYARLGDEKWKELACGRQRTKRTALAIVKALRESWSFQSHDFRVDKCETVKVFKPFAPKHENQR
jgi:hypothetical protein